MVDDHYSLLNSLFEETKELKKMLPDRLKTNVNIASSYILYLRSLDDNRFDPVVSDLAISESLMFILMAVYGDDFDRSIKVVNLLKNRVETLEKNYNVKFGGVDG